MHAAVLANALQQIHVIVISFVLYKIDPANETNRASNTLLTDSHEIAYIHDYNLRGSNYDLQLPLPKTNFLKRSFS